MNAQTIAVTIHGLAAGGDGVGKDADGRTVFVAATAPGEDVTAAVVERHARWARAELVTITRAGVGRIAPACPLFAARTCGGCDWAHVDAATQAAAKQAIVAGAVRRLVAGGATLAPLAQPERAWGWRRRARFAIAGGAIGFHAPRARTVTDVDACPQLAPELAAALAAVRAAAATVIAGAGELHLVAGTGGAHAVIDAPCHGEQARALIGHGGLVGVVWPGGKAGLAAVELEPGLRVRADEFAQAGAAGNQALRAAVAAAVAARPGERVLELYAGNGNFTRDLIAAGAEVTATDAVAPRDAAAVAAQFVAGPAAAVVPALVAAGQRFDVVLLDPPRTGAKDVIGHLAATGAGRIVYVSCDPATFARDGERLVAAGFAARTIAAFDLMPQTAHVELVAQFERALDPA
ncbi:MAG: class I SAM-dependent RNA methyltransferase [Myxococcales bacterium]|nr:class I SAM-dependent RNA methyltransferase [Myxococcales bacterium]